MHPTSTRRAHQWLSIVACLAVASGIGAAETTDLQLQFFENEIRPILIEHCYECHSVDSDTAEGGLFLDNRDGWSNGGDSGPTIVPGDPDSSLLMEAVSYKNIDLQMPPDGKLSAEQVELLRTWIEAGAHDPRTAESALSAKEVFDLDERREDHWCWRPIAATTPPQVDSDWPQKEIDAFILNRLQENKLTPASPADKRTLLRRMTFATIGLPPTPSEIRAYLDDESAEATEKVVHRLLDSPHFGENWGQHWLDLMRFAETRGHEQDFPIPEAYRYRDYVIESFNEDVPYDQFVTEHIAGDLLEQPRLHPSNRTNQSIQGTGFWQLHDATHSPVDICGDEALRIQNQIDVFSRSFLGLSLGCARCHDHKFDAISTRDYYAMYGYLQSSSYHLADVSDPTQQAHVAQSLAELNQQHGSTLRQLIANKLEEQAVLLRRYRAPTTASFESQESIERESATRARELSLNAQTLTNLARYLRGEVSVNSPFKAWSLAASRTAEGEDIDFSDIVDELKHFRQVAARDNERAWQRLTVTRSVKDGERNYQPVSREWSENDMVEDFDSAEYPHWITAGQRFGQGPVNIGTMILGQDPARPVAWFVDRSSASSETLSGKLTGLLRTRTFEVTGDQIWYRYRGNGAVFLDVDSHRVVAGPLHGVVKQELKSEDQQWKWSSQHVRDYVGHRVHIEFTGGPGFAVDQVIFAASEPPALPIVLATVDVPQLLEDIAVRLRENQLTASDAITLNWWLDHPELFPEVEDDAISAEVKSYHEKKEAIEATIPAPILALTLLDGSGEDEHVHIRGNHRNRSKETVPRQPLTALGELDNESTQGSGRLALARKLTDPKNPLLARVYVNRIWHHLFGRGIVESVDDFGVMGKPPTHPQLLDYLARRFMDNGWSTKWLIRELMLSQTYQMSSIPNPRNEQIDPTNRFLHRMPVRRLTGEVIRDHLLAVSGRLDRRQFGESVKVHITPFMRGNRTPRGSGPVDGDGRRSIYTEVRRNTLPAFLAAFDKPPPFMAIGKRTVSNSPTQSLILLNDPLVHEQALRWAKRLIENQPTHDERIAAAFEQAFARLPGPTEIEAALIFLRAQEKAYVDEENTTKHQATELAWRDLCHTLFNVKEFIHVN